MLPALARGGVHGGWLQWLVGAQFSPAFGITFPALGSRSILSQHGS